MKNVKRYIVISSSIVLIIFLVTYLSLTFYVGSRALDDTAKEADAIMVLGARAYIDNQYNPCLEARVAHAVDLYQEGYAETLLMTGGTDKEDNVNEAEAMKKIAVEKGANPDDIILEKAATSTYENFTLSQDILEKNNLDSVIIVTEPFHVARASLVAEKLGYDYAVSPAEESPCWQTYTYFSRYFLKEPIAILVYKLQNKL